MIVHTCMSIEGAIINAKYLKGAITVDGYTVRKATIKAGNRNKTVLEAYKEEESGKSKEE